MSAASRIFGLIPAAGQSVRMGRSKLALPLGGGTLLEHVIAALRQARLDDILVVLGPHVAELADVTTRAGAQALVLAQQTEHMRQTLEYGLAWLEREHEPRPEDWLLLVPADHPTLDAEVIRVLVAARGQYPEATILVPTYGGRRGHPLLITWSQVAAVRALPSDEGLNRYVRGQVPQTREVPVITPEVLRDLDTPEDYERLLADWQRLSET